MTITLKQLNKATPQIVGVRGQLIVDAVNDIFPLYGVNEREEVAALLSNLFHESAYLTRFEENLNYSIKGLLNTFSRARISVSQCNAYGRIDGKRPANKSAIANTVYGGAWGKTNLGNTQPNDGWELRGAGGLQLTGRFVLSAFTHYYNKRFDTFITIQKMAEMLRQPYNIKLTMHAACWFVSIYKNLLPLATNTAKFRKGINGGNLGLDEVTKIYNKLLSEIK